MSVTITSWLQQVAAIFSTGIARKRALGRQRRKNRVAALSAPVLALAESLEHRQLLAAADVSVISVSGNPGQTVQLPVDVTRWSNLAPDESLAAFDVVLRYDTQRLDLASSNVSLGTFFQQNNWSFSANVSDLDGFVSITANSPTDQPTPVPTALPRLVTLSFSISPTAFSGSAAVDLLQDPDGFTTIHGGDDFSFDTSIFSGAVTVNGGGGGGGGGGGPDSPLANDDPAPGAPGFSTSENTTFITGNVLDNDTDPFDSPIEIFSFTQPQRGPESAGRVESRGNGTFEFFPGTDFDYLTSGQVDFATFEYVIRNQFNQTSAPASVTILVNGVNDTPMISSIATQTMSEDGVLSNLSFTVTDPDDSTLAVTATSNNATLLPQGALSLSGLGNNRLLSITPAANLSGQATITLTVSDGLNSAQTSFSLTVQPVNDAPQISDITGQSTPEDTPILNLPFSVSDIDGDILSVSATSSSPTLFPSGSLIVSGSGNSRSLTINPAANLSGQATITVTVSDGDKTNSTTFDIFVNAVNDPPSVSTVPDQTTSEDVPITGIPLTVIDVDNAEISIIINNSNPILLPPGSIVVSGTGPGRTLSITPAANQSGNASVILTASDGQATAQIAFNVFVSPVNDAPVISSIGNQTVLEDGVLANIPFTISDAEGDALSLSVTTSNPTLLPLPAITLSGTGSSRQISITPAAGLSGNGTVTVFVTDGVTTASSSFTVQVTAVNDAPVISPIAAQSLNEDGSLTGIAFTVSDEDSPALTVTASSNNLLLLPAGSLVITGTGPGRQLAVSPAANRFGTAVVTVTVSDGQTSASSTFNLSVNSVNDPPVAVADSASVSADTPVVISVLANDTDVDGTLNPASVEIVTPPASGTAVPGSNGTITFTPGPGSSGIVTFSYRVSDNESTVSAPTIVSVNVITNAAPVIQPVADQTLSVGGASLQIPLSVSDADGDPLQISVTSSVPGLLSTLSITGTGSSRTLQLAPGTRPGLAQVTVTATDGVNAPVTRTFNVNVGLIIDAGAARSTTGVMTHRGYANSVAVPFSTSAAVAGVPEDVPATLFRTNVFDNPGRPELLFSIPTVPGQVYDVDLWFAEIWSGAFGVGRRVFDVMLEGSLAIDNLDVFATVGRNRALTRSFQVTGDGNLSVELLHVIQNPNISGIRVRPAAAPNTPPTITPVAAQQTSEDTPVSAIQFSVADAEQQPLTVTVSSADTTLLPQAGLLITGTGAARQLAITPAANRFGTTQVSLSVSDGRATTTTSFTVTVNSVNDPPTASSDNATTRVSTAVTIAVLSNDSDLDGTLNPASVAITQQSANGTAVPYSDGTISFTPTPDFNGTATFTYTVRDNQGGESQPATVSVLVRNNSAPVISPITDKEVLLGSNSGPIAFTVSDTDGDNLTVTAVAGDSSLVRSVTVTGTGTNRQLAFTAGDLAGFTRILISVSDGNNPPVTQLVPVSVFALIDAGTGSPTAGSLADRNFLSGAGIRFNGSAPVTTTPGTLAASVPDLFYRSTLFDIPGGKDLEFDVNAKAGQTFAVDLFFAEVWSGAFGQGKRVFDVSIDGETVLNKFDVFKEAGRGNVGIARRFIINSDGKIDIDLRRAIQNPMLSGLKVTPLGDFTET